MVVVLMGVTGSGKTTAGRRLARDLGWRFLDADDFHPAVNVAKMKRGSPLTEADRTPWLDALGKAIRALDREESSAVLACSALKSAHRQKLRSSGEDVRFIYLRISPEIARGRLGKRRGHFMSASLAESQFDVLEEPQDALAVDGSQSIERVVARVREGLGV